MNGVGVDFVKGIEMLNESGVRRQRGIGPNQRLCRRYRRFKEGIVSQLVGQAELHTAVLTDGAVSRGKEITGAAELQVMLGDLVAVVCLLHNIQAALCILTVGIGNQNAVGLGIASAYAAS